MDLNLPHLHLLLNHVPTVGSVVSLGLLVTAMVRRDAGLTRAALELFYGVALLTLPAFVTGAATQAALAEVPEVSTDAIVRHLDAAVLGSALMLFTGICAWLALWQRQRGDSSAGATRAVLVLGVLTLAVMGGAASLGGEIRHPEIVVGEPTSGDAVPGFIKAAALQGLVLNNTWLWPALEVLHFLGLAILFGVLILVNTRLLGGLPTVSYRALHRLIPWAALSLAVNVVTGMLFFLATPEQYAANISFHAKLVFLVIAGANLLYLTESDQPFQVGPNDPPPTMAKAMAAISLLSWIGVMYYGRMLPFIGEAF